MNIRRSITLVLAATALLVAGCGSDKSSSGSGSTPSTDASATSTAPGSEPAGSSAGGSTTHLSNEADEDGGLYFAKKKLKASAGRVTITLENPKSSGKSHGIAIEGKGVDRDGKVVQPGGKSTVTVELRPGRYSFYCPVPGHEQAGMKGTLVVQ